MFRRNQVMRPAWGRFAGQALDISKRNGVYRELTLRVTGRRRAKRGGYPPATLAGGPVDARVRAHRSLARRYIVARC